jgi:hypothetical protein
MLSSYSEYQLVRGPQNGNMGNPGRELCLVTVTTYHLIPIGIGHCMS